MWQELKLKVRKFCGLIPMFVEVTREKLVGSLFTSPYSLSWITLSKLLFECDIYNAHFHQEDVFRNIEALAGYLAIYACLMFEFANFIDKGYSHKSHYHKTSKTTYKRVKVHLKLLWLILLSQIQLVTNATKFLLIMH